MDLGLDGCRAVVTGASAGIGRASALALAAEGVHVAIVARSAGDLELLAEEIAGAGMAQPLLVCADLTDRSAPAFIRDQVERELGGVDILVNNAGQADPPGAALDEDAWRRIFELNFHAKRRLASELSPLLVNSGRGRVINMVGILEPFGVSAAQAAVAACITWSKGISRTVAADGITVNCLAPGRIDSDQMRRHFPTPESRQAFADQYIPMKRFGSPEEAAALVVWLASTAASYVTGETITVDGGMHRRA
jgi:3-oxoacyl-[acyl-carrier protein] reductase